jgi:hypothetical protein
VYNIQLISDPIDVQVFIWKLQEAIMLDGRFRVDTWCDEVIHQGRGKARRAYKVVAFKGVRLTTKKPYCGNHPGPCLLGGRKKPTTNLLEWDDWVAFHTLVNRFLDKRMISANVWTTPQDVKGKMWIRKGLQGRVRYDYTETYPQFAGIRTVAPLRVWNQGTEDQFQPEAR